MLEIKLWAVQVLDKYPATALHSSKVNPHLLALICV